MNERGGFHGLLINCEDYGRTTIPDRLTASADEEAKVQPGYLSAVFKRGVGPVMRRGVFYISFLSEEVPS